MKSLVRALLVVALASTPAAAQQARLPAELQLPLLVKVLSFDRGLISRSEVVIAVVYQPDVATSARVRDAWLNAARTPASLGNTPVRVVALEYRNDDALLSDLEQANASVVFLSPLRAADTRALAERCRVAGFRTASDERDLVDHSVAVGLLLRDGRPRIVINMPLAQREGSDFSSQLLRVAEVIK